MREGSESAVTSRCNGEAKLFKMKNMTTTFLAQISLVLGLSNK